MVRKGFLEGIKFKHTPEGEISAGGMKGEPGGMWRKGGGTKPLPALSPHPQYGSYSEPREVSFGSLAPPIHLQRNLGKLPNFSVPQLIHL